MADKSEPYAYIDLGALHAAALAEGDSSADVFELDDMRLPRGKVLLLLTSYGMELVRIPKVLH